MLGKGGAAMPTAVEYATAHPWHAQNGCGSGPPALNLFHTQNGAGGGPPVLNLWEAQNGVGSGPPAHNTVLQQHVLPGPVPGDALLTGLFTVPLVLVTLVVALRRRLTLPYPAPASARRPRQ
jgi:hypothetical protein